MVPAAGRHPIAVSPTRVGSRDPDIAVTYVFGDGSIAAITFSAKGHTFEGVRERFAAHKGNALISMDDFQTLTIERGHEKKTTRLRSRDHGHGRSILRSYAMARPPAGQPGAGLSVDHVWETGELFLRTREALEEGRRLEVEAFEPRP
jgi:hypothetical protein